MSKFPYCESCLEQPKTGKEAQSSFYDYRFDYPVCLNCVTEHSLEPEEEVA